MMNSTTPTTEVQPGNPVFVDRRQNSDTAPVSSQSSDTFVDRRQNAQNAPYGVERRQFGNSYNHLSPAARELAEAIDGYKVQHRRRYVTYEEMLQVIQSLGYHR